MLRIKGDMCYVYMCLKISSEHEKQEPQGE